MHYSLNNPTSCKLSEKEVRKKRQSTMMETQKEFIDRSFVHRHKSRLLMKIKSKTNSMLFNPLQRMSSRLSVAKSRVWRKSRAWRGNRVGVDEVFGCDGDDSEDENEKEGMFDFLFRPLPSNHRMRMVWNTISILFTVYLLIVVPLESFILPKYDYFEGEPRRVYESKNNFNPTQPNPTQPNQTRRRS